MPTPSQHQTSIILAGAGTPPQAALFRTTHWTVILNAADTDSPQASEAMSHLCTVYWYPLYAYVRRQGYQPAVAQDLTQEFLERLLARNYLRSLDRQKGRFRSFLLAAMEHFLAKQWRDANRLKRGGGQVIVSLDECDAEGRYVNDAVDEVTADRIYERRWALALLDQAMKNLREEFVAAGRLPLFEALEVYLTGERTEATYAALGTTLDMTEGAVKVAVHRVRARYGELVRAEIAHTVSRPEDVEDELRHLLSTLAA
jgi:DNA-directed RNA polymerase specialized sigma24 family protein